MKAAFVHKPGPAETIQVGELPDPECGPTQVLVRVAVAAVNPIDTYVRGGLVAMDLPSPYIVGADFAGVVEAVGEAVDELRVGERVWGSNQGLLGRQGATAQRIAVDKHWCYPTPAGVDDAAAAAGALVGITAHLGLTREARLKAGETLLVNGGSGGVGSAVVQLGRALGARVVATAGSEEKRRRCLDLGADLAINYRTEDVAERVRAFAPQGLDVWWETTREPDFDRVVALLAERGRMVLMAGRDARPPFPVGPFYVKGCSLHGFVVFKATPDEQRRSADALNRWLAEGAYQPLVGQELPLEQAAEAHRLQEEKTLRGAGGMEGKIVVRVAPSAG